MEQESSDDKKCDFCKKRVEKLFYCKNCHGDQIDSDSDHKPLCKVCVMPHLQCDHIITDQKGNEALFCTEHKMLQNEYCRTCDKVFCWGCVPKHSEHKFDSLDNRASELRTKVFESLSELENKEKLVNTSKSTIEDKIQKHEQELKVLRETIATETEKIKRTGLIVIDESCDIMKEHLKTVDNVLNLQQKLRELLSVSNDHLVDQFKIVEKDVEQIRIAVDKMQKQEKVRILSCKVGLIVTKLKQLHDSIYEDLKSVLLDQSYVCYRQEGTCYRVLAGTGKILLEDINFDDSGSLSYTNDRSEKITGEVTHCFFSSGPAKLLVLTSSKEAYLADPSDTSLKLTSTSYPTRNNLLWPYYVENRECPDWSYWEEGAIKFSTTSFNVECETIPSVRMGQCICWNWLFFITSNNTVILADFKRGLQARFTIADSDGISCVSNIDSYSLFFFSVDGNFFYTAYWLGNYFNFSQPLKHNWDNHSKVIAVTVNNRNYSVHRETNTPDSQNPHLFMLKFARTN